MSASPFALVRLGPIINRWKFLIGMALVLAAIISIVVALLLPNIYKSTAVFFPTVPESTDPDRLLDEKQEKRSVLSVSGRSEDLDRVITIGESQPVAELIIKKYKLHEHYGMGAPGDDVADNSVLNEFLSNLGVVHTERDAVELSFMDRDKFLAARVTNDIMHAIDSVNQQLTLENRRKLLNLYGLQYEELSASHERVRKQLVSVRKRYGIFDRVMQGRYLAKQLVETEAELRKAEAGGNTAGPKRVLRGLTQAAGGNLMNTESFTQGVDSFDILVNRLDNMQTRLVDIDALYSTAKVGLKGQVSSIYVVQKAYPATRKIKPVRWLIVLGSVLATFALSVVVVSLLELNRHHRQTQGGNS